MKTKLLKLTTMVLVAMLSISACDKDQDVVLSEADIPTAILDYVSSFFVDHSILRVEMETEKASLSYDVDLSDGVDLEFNEALEIVSIESVSQLPDTVIPQPIHQYVDSLYADEYIREWDLENNYQQVGLSNDLELEFDLDGEFVRVDRD